MKQPEQQPDTDPIQEIFDHWRNIMGFKRARLDDKRRKLISDRLRNGYALADLLDAISGCFLSPFHQGDNQDCRKYCDLELILRDAKHVDQFVALYDEVDERFQRIQVKQSTEVSTAAWPDAEKRKERLEAMRKAMR